MKTLALGLFLISLIACDIRTVHFNHSPVSASKSAEEFAQVALVEHDSTGAFKLLHEEAKQKTTIADLSAWIDQIHPTGFPSEIDATEFEPMFGHRGMNIFLIGMRQDEHYYYRLTMIGTAESGYRVVSIHRNDGPYPPSPTRKTCAAM